MMTANRTVRQLAIAGSLLLPLLAAGTARQEPASLRLSNAPVQLLYPEEWDDWAISLGSYADSAARDISELIHVPIPAGTILWQPAAAGPGSGADGSVEVRADKGGGALVIVRTNVPLLTRDFGVAYALGYGRWLGAYVASRVAMGAPGGNAPWWTEGAALYLTDRLFRKSRATTPILYGLEGNFTRASRSRRPIDLAAKTLSDAARGKAYATFKLLEGLYGPDVVARTIGQLVARPSSDLATIVDAIGRDRQPNPDEVLRDWLEPTVAIDVGIHKVSVRDGGKLTIRIDRETPIPLPVLAEVRCVEGQTVTGTLAAGTGDGTLEIDIPSEPVSVTLDPGHLIPDTNRSNNRHGFGNAENVRRFFSFDDLFQIRELQLSGELGLDESGQRQEAFTLLITNRTERATGLGILVSAEWLGRPERVQRAYFVNFAPGETRLIEEMLGYPNRGTGRARIEARFWHAGTVEDLTDKLVSKEPGAMNSYIVLRDAPKAPRRPRRGLYRRPPTITETAGTRQEAPPDKSAVATTPVATTASTTGAEVEMGDLAAGEGFGLRIVSPTSSAIPIGDVTLEASLLGSDESAERVDFFVNDRRVGTVTEPPYVFRWTFPEEEQVFVIRAVALLGDQLASDDVVLDKSAVAFGSTVNLVTLHATIRDAQGRIVRDLTGDDVRVIEDGQQQELVQFDFGEVPISAAVLLDQSSSMLGAGIRSERSGAQLLIDAIVNDVNRAMVLGFTDKVYLYADFTHDREQLSTALAAIEPDGSTALYDTLAESVRKLNRRRGKRALVVLSDGLDTNSRLKFEDVVEYLRQSEVLVYTIGLQLMAEGTELGDASRAVKRGVEQLRTMAEATGGAAYFPLNMEELEEIYGLIADELESQYALSYYPENSRYDGTWRKLRVDVPGHPGYWVRVRPGYYGISQQQR